MRRALRLPLRCLFMFSTVPWHSPVIASLYVWEGQAGRHAPLCRVASGSTQTSQSLLFGPSHKAQSGWQRKHSLSSLSSKKLSGQSGTHWPSWRTWYSSQPAQRTANTEWKNDLVQLYCPKVLERNARETWMKKKIDLGQVSHVVHYDKHTHLYTAVGIKTTTLEPCGEHDKHPTCR